MSLDPITSFIDLVKTGFDKFLPDATQKAQAVAALENMRESHDFQNQMAQLAINLQDSKSSSFMQNGWRPSLAWICIGDVMYEVIVFPVAHSWFPILESANAIGTTMPILLTLIGARGLDKWNNKDTK